MDHKDTMKAGIQEHFWLNLWHGQGGLQSLVSVPEDYLGKAYLHQPRAGHRSSHKPPDLGLRQFWLSHKPHCEVFVGTDGI